MLTILQGDALTKLRELPAESVQCCVTSPPYWGLRDYGVSGQIGLEETPEAYVAKVVEVFSEVRRVLKNDGTLWLNLGDSYATAGGYAGDEMPSNREGKQRTNGGAVTRGRKPQAPGLKPKDLCGIPWRVAFALQAGVWYLRSDIIWHKPNPMPESVADRPTKAHEYLFLMSKQARYFYDADAIREAHATEEHVPGNKFSHDKIAGPNSRNGHSQWEGDPNRTWFNSKGRNKRSVWTVPAAPYAEAHFATFPPDLIKPCILAGSRPCDTILDPFGGSGTTGAVAIELGRKAILIELNPEYVKLAEQRCSITPGFAL